MASHKECQRTAMSFLYHIEEDLAAAAKFMGLAKRTDYRDELRVALKTIKKVRKAAKRCG